MQVTIYTDGACDIHADNQPGGWAAIICATDARGNVLKETVLSGGQEMTTNNRMELRAVIEGLRALSQPSNATIVTDSRYVIDIATGRHRIHTNQELWREYLSAEERHDVTWQFVAGHSGDAYNERCDKLAVAERKKLALHTVTSVQHEPLDSAATAIEIYLATKHSTKTKSTAWSAYIVRDGSVEIFGGVVQNSTKYEALLHGAAQVLSYGSVDESITVHSTDPNFVTSITERVSRWKQNNWTYRFRDEVKPIKYKNHWQKLMRLKQERKAKFSNDESLRNTTPYKRARHIAGWLLKNSEKGSMC